MGIFNRYLKEGPGIDKDAPKKRGIFLYAELLGRKFFDIIKANCLFSLESLPFFAIILLFVAPVMRSVFVPTELIDSAKMQILMDIFFAGFIFNFFGSGPASAAYAYVTRSFTRSEHVYIASDGWDAIKDNLKYSILLFIVDVVVIFISMNAIAFYGAGNDTISMFLRFFILILFVVYAISHIFTYQIMVTYECKFIDVIKYSVMMSVAKLPMCALLGLISGIVWVLLWYFLGIPGVIIYFIVGLMFSRYPFEFYSSRVIAKNIEKTSKNEDKKEDK